MNKLILSLGLTVLSSIGAQAALVTYSTVGSELCIGASCGGSVDIDGIVRITFTPIASSTVNANPLTFGSFGELTVSCIAGGTACAEVTLPGGLVLNILVTQTAPTAGSASIASGTIAGTLSGSSSGAAITWPVPNAILLGAIQYSVANNPLGLVPPSVNGGVTTIQAVITEIETPEPGTYAMLASGLIALGLTRRKR